MSVTRSIVKNCCGLLLVGLWAAAGLSCSKAKVEKDGGVVGSWIRQDNSGNSFGLTFYENGTYMLRLDGLKVMFPGVYEISSGTIRLTDRYCGSKLPGVYKLRTTGEKIAMEAVDDPSCDRNKFLPGEWGRTLAAEDTLGYKTWSGLSSISQDYAAESTH